jgi:hypothetical protein
MISGAYSTYSAEKEQQSSNHSRKNTIKSRPKTEHQSAYQWTQQWVKNRPARQKATAIMAVSMALYSFFNSNSDVAKTSNSFFVNDVFPTAVQPVSGAKGWSIPVKIVGGVVGSVLLGGLILAAVKYSQEEVISYNLELEEKKLYSEMQMEVGDIKNDDKELLKNLSYKKFQELEKELKNLSGDSLKNLFGDSTKKNRKHDRQDRQDKAIKKNNKDLFFTEDPFFTAYKYQVNKINSNEFLK